MDIDKGKPNYYSIIPASVRYDNDLTPTAKLLYSEITALSNKTGICFARDKYFAEIYDVSDRVIRKYLKQLKEKNYIDIEYEYEGNTKKIKQRKLYIISMEQKFHIYGTKVPEDMEQKYHTYIDNNKYINNKKENLKRKVLDNNNLSLKIKESLIEWLNYKNYSYKELGLTKLISQVENYLKNYTEEELIDVIDKSIANNYQGIVFEKLNNKTKKTNYQPTMTKSDDGVFHIV